MVFIRHLLATALFAACCVQHSTGAGSPVGPVRIDIVEGIPDETSWKFTAGAPAES